MLLIPAIDLRNGRCVRLFKGDFNAETRYEYDPLDLYERYRDRLLGIPIHSPLVRSLNLSTSVALAVYEVLRQRSISL
jgi:hypothetical protein